MVFHAGGLFDPTPLAALPLPLNVGGAKDRRTSGRRVVVLRASSPCEEEPGPGTSPDDQSILPVSGAPSPVDRGKRLENRTLDDTGRQPEKRLENRSAGKPVTTDNLLTNSATLSDESPQESYHKKSQEPLVLAFLWSLPSAGLRKVEYGKKAGNLTICRQILPQSAMSPHKSYHNKSQEPLALAWGHQTQPAKSSKTGNQRKPEEDPLGATRPSRTDRPEPPNGAIAQV